MDAILVVLILAICIGLGVAVIMAIVKGVKR
jgi:hypothetical protein